ncbi:MAG: hypothetical protein H0X66_18770 [Verrucomicrobia bacterium]|nr:hypothetical protein [Verrucomicrobiota bacterium]
MGLLNFFSKTDDVSNLTRLSSGSITVDSEGTIITSTLPRSFPEMQVEEISSRVLKIFKDAKEAQMPLTELILEFPALKITARELRGGAIIFLAPSSPKVPKSGS